MNGPWIAAYTEDRSIPTAFGPDNYAYNVGGATTASPVDALNATSGYSTDPGLSYPFFQLLNERFDASTVQTRVDQIPWPLALDAGWLAPPSIDPADWPIGAVGYEYEADQVTVDAAVLLGDLTVDNSGTASQGSTGQLRALTSDSWATIADVSSAPLVAETLSAAAGTSETLTLNHDVTAHLTDDGADGLIAWFLAYPGAALTTASGYGNWPPAPGIGDLVTVTGTAGSGSLFFGGTVEVTVPRHRFLYDVVPPLRQFPRSDGLVGTGGARALAANTRQASIRQGWNGTTY